MRSTSTVCCVICLSYYTIIWSIQCKTTRAHTNVYFELTNKSFDWSLISQLFGFFLLLCIFKMEPGLHLQQDDRKRIVQFVVSKILRLQNNYRGVNFLKTSSTEPENAPNLFLYLYNSVKSTMCSNIFLFVKMAY